MDRLLGERWLFVHVVREPTDTVASMEGRFPLALPPISRPGGSLPVVLEAGLTLEAAQPERAFRVVYEELCARPEETFAALMTWLGEELEPVQLAFNDVAHDEGLEDPDVSCTDRVHADSVGRWRSVFTEAEAELVRARTNEVWARIDRSRPPR